MVDSYIHLSIIFPKAYGYTVQLENRKIKNAFNSLNLYFRVLLLLRIWTVSDGHWVG